MKAKPALSLSLIIYETSQKMKAKPALSLSLRIYETSQKMKAKPALSPSNVYLYTPTFRCNKLPFFPEIRARID